MAMHRRVLGKQMDLCTGPFFKKIIIYTLPIIATSILQLLFNAADLIVVGQFGGSYSDKAISAVGATGSLINLLVGLFMGLSLGAGVCVAQGIGARDDARVSRAVHTAIPAATICGAFLTVVGIALAPVLLELMDTPEEVIDLSVIYMRIYFAGIIPNLLYNFGAAILRSAGDTRSPLIYLTVAGVLNVVLNLFFVLVCRMTVDGVALATALAQTVSCVLVLRKLMLREDACKIVLKKLRIDGPALKRMIRIGLPAGVQGSLFAISNVTIQSSINSFGPVVLAGSTAAGNIEGFVYVAMNSFQQTAMTFVGQNMGAAKYKNIGKVTGLCLLCSGVIGIVTGGACRLAAPQLLSIYLKDNAQAIAYGVTRMNYVCLLYFMCGLMDVLSGSMRGMGASTVPMAVTVLGVCGLRILWIATIFQKVHTVECLFLSYPVSWVVTVTTLAVCFMVLWTKTMKKQKLQLKQA